MTGKMKPGGMQDGSPELDRASAESVEGKEIVIRQAAAGSVRGDRVVVRQGASLRIEADEVDSTQGAALLVTCEKAELESAWAGVVAARGDIEMDQSAARVVLAKGDVSMDQCGSLLTVGREVRAQRSSSFMILAGRVEGEVSSRFGPRESLLFGAAAGLAAGLVISVFGALFRRGDD